MRFLLRIIQAFVGAVVTAIFAVSRTGLSAKGRSAHWTREDVPVAVAILAISVIAFVVPVVEGISEKRRRGGENLARTFDDVLMAEFGLIQQASGLIYSDIGLHAFIVHRSLRHPLRGEQLRVARIRLGHVGIDHELVWTRGKGVIGLCWSRGTDQILDYEAWVTKHTSDTANTWSQLDAEERLGLTFREFTRTKTNFGAIAATPMFDTRGQFRGSVSADGPKGSFQQLASPDVVDRLQATAQVLARILRPVAE